MNNYYYAVIILDVWLFAFIVERIESIVLSIIYIIECISIVKQLLHEPQTTD
jgi:hypothetical protein